MVKIVDRQVQGLPIIEWVKGKPTVIVAHETANDSNNGSYEGEIKHMSNNYKNAFFHLIAGENDVALLHDPEKGGAWGAGHTMHNYAIHIELVRSSTKEGFKKAYKNYIGAIKHYAKKYNIPVAVNKGTDKTGIYTHHYVTKTFGGTTHTDPDAYFKKYGKTISQFAKDLGASGGAVETEAVTTEWEKVTGDWTGQTLKPGQYGEPVRQMQQAMADNSPPFYPKKGSKNNGIDEYYGKLAESTVTRYQEYNGLGVDGLAGIEVYNSLKGKKAPDKPKKASQAKGDMKTNSIVDYLKSINESTSKENRKKLAKEYGVADYDLSAKKNTELLKAMRSGNKTSSGGQKKGTVHLPASAKTWKTYRLSVQPVSKNSDWSLTPSKFGGLTYEIAGKPYPDVVTIKTSKGMRNIYVGSNTSAIIN